MGIHMHVKCPVNGFIYKFFFNIIIIIIYIIYISYSYMIRFPFFFGQLEI